MVKRETVVKVYQVKDEVIPIGRSLLSEIGWGEIPVDYQRNHELVAEVKTGKQGDSALDEAYRLTQNMDEAWVMSRHQGLRVVGSPTGRRSSHIGDVFVVEGEAYVCVPVGFEKLISADQKVVRG